MNLFKTSFWSAIATVFKILAGLVTNKIMAIFVGPGGIALLGNFANITGIASTFANGAIGSGVVKYIAEFENDENKKRVISTALKINLMCSFAIGFIVLAFNKALTQLTFNDTKYNSVFLIFGLTIIFYGLNTTITSVLNGYKNIKYLIITGLIGSAISLALAVIITIQFGLYGALINTMIAQLCIFLVNLFFIKKLNLQLTKIWQIPYNRELSIKLFKYGLMSIASLSGTASLFFIRNYIYTNFSPAEAGYIQGVWTISSNYLLVITTSLTIYYLPTLSSIKEKAGIRSEILKGYKFLLPIAILGGLSIFLCRNLIIRILFTVAFTPMKDYFAFQLIGDTFKIAAWILSYLMVAKAMTRYFIASEIIFSILYVTIGLLFMHFFGSIGITYAYAISYMLYLLFLIFLLRQYIVNKSIQKITGV
jgi:PST family polysaccharide transporter